ncbi:transketolase family protein [Deinococcus aquaedulcis]|uniref:transketolase family protein n=1 Tax=Deinococcus aquaedulcis TaxID=2840455 RepID=UPI001C8355E2|nr:transketolase C-terminal domain-containing protein [Deinococcus aquaedulcis]
MRDAFSSELVRLAQSDPRIRMLTGDHGYALFDEFRRTCPQYFINAGIAEQNMVGVAAGMAQAGLRPLVYGLSAFVPVRVLEQIKLDVCYVGLPVTFIGDGAGVVYSALGSSHQSTEDIAALRALPGIDIYSPADAYEMRACMQLAYERARPAYIRMGKADLGSVHTQVPEFEAGELLQVDRGEGDISFIATGSMAITARQLAAHYPTRGVWTAPMIKPISEAQVTQIARNSRLIVVLEEHATAGGLGSLVSEIVTARAPTYVCRIGIEDRFSEFCGTYDYLMHEHGLNLEAVREKVDAFLGQIQAP